MTAMTFDTAHQSPRPMTWLSRAAVRFLRAIEELAASRARRSVPERELRRIKRQIGRYDRLMQAEKAKHPSQNKARQHMKTVRVNAR